MESGMHAYSNFLSCMLTGAGDDEMLLKKGGA